MRKCFLTFLACPVQEKKKNIKFLLASLKTATNSKISGITFFSEQLLQSGGYPKAEASSLTSVIIRIFIISYFIEAERNFFLYFLHKKTSINCENLQRSFQKCCFDFQDLSIPKAIHLVNYPFKRKFANAEEGWVALPFVWKQQGRGSALKQTFINPCPDSAFLKKFGYGSWVRFIRAIFAAFYTQICVSCYVSYAI